MATNAATLFLDIDSRMAADAAKKLQQLGVSADKAGKEADRLAAKFDKNYTATKKLTQEYKDLDSAFNVGYISAQQYAAGVQQVDMALARLRGEVPAVAQGMHVVAASYEQSTVAIQRANTAMQQSSHHSTNLMFQLQDIGMMMAAGQNPFMLMMQQGSQVAGIFGQMQAEGKKIGPTITGAFTQLLNPMTAVTFAVIGGSAALVQWIASLGQADDAADEANTSVSQLGSSIAGYQSAYTQAATTVAALRYEYGALGDAIFAVYQEEVQLRKFQLTTSMQRAQTGISSEIQAVRDLAEAYNFAMGEAQALAMVGQRGQMQAVLDSAVIEVTRLNEEFGLTTVQANELLTLIDRFSASTGMEDASANAKELTEWVREAQDDGAKLTDEFVDMIIELGGVNSQLATMLGTLQRAATAASQIVIPSFTMSLPDERGSQRGVFGSAAEYNSSQRLSELEAFWESQGITGSGAGGGGGRGGGGGGSRGRSEADRIREEMEDRVKALQESWLTESQVIAQQYATDQETLQWALDQKLIVEDEYNQRRVEMQRKYSTEIQALQLAEYSAAFTAAGGLYAELATLNGEGNDKILRNQRKFAAASALISAYQGAAAALADPNISWIGRIAAYGSVLAAGLGAYNAIKGGGTGGAANTATAAAAAPQQQKAEPVKNVLVKLEGDAMFMDMAENIMQQIYRQSENGRVIIARG